MDPYEIPVYLKQYVQHPATITIELFCYQVALYTRNELNIRTTANFLLAFAAFTHACRPFLSKYYSASVRLPSDWIDIAEQFTVFSDRSLARGGLPAALRRAMVAKFPDFDKYQLGKEMVRLVVAVNGMAYGGELHGIW